MRVIDPGHRYALAHLDGDSEELLTFVKREGHGYPGNFGSHPGTNLQEVLRALIARMEYLNNQIPHWRNVAVIIQFRAALENLEFRSAERHGRILFQTEADELMEHRPFCAKCGHVGCAEDCLAPQTNTTNPEAPTGGSQKR